jgi:hypothetical protein
MSPNLLQKIWEHGLRAPTAQRYGLAITAALAVSLLRMAFNPLWGENFAYVFYFPVTLFTALYGGFGPAVATLLIPSIMTALFVAYPFSRSIASEPTNLQKLASFILIDVLLAWFGSLHRAHFSERQVHHKMISAQAEKLRENEQRLAADLDAMTRLFELGTKCADTRKSVKSCLDAALETAMAVTRADKGSIQLFDVESAALRIAVHRGFDERFLAGIAKPSASDPSAVAHALTTSERSITLDVSDADSFAMPFSPGILLSEGIRAIKSTPLISSTGRVLGMISIYFSCPHQPAARELRFLDLLARQTADYLDRGRAAVEREMLLVSEPTPASAPSR